MQEEKLTKQLRPVVAHLLVRPLLLMGLSANTITVLNFFIFCLPAVWCILKGHNIWALTFCMLATLIDFVDGEVAKAKGGHTKLGEWLDTSLDWLWQLLILWAIIVISGSIVWVYISAWALVMTVFSNYLSGKPLHLDSFPFVMKHFLFFGLLFNRLDIAIYLIAISYTIKAGILGYASIKWRSL